VVPAVEEVSTGEPEELVRQNALTKAQAGRATAASAGLVVGCDTEVFLDGVALGKARDRDEAETHLAALSGRTHTVLGGLVVLGAEGPGSRAGERTGVSRTEVTFRRLDAEITSAYLDSGEWRGRAGAYAIQGLGSSMVTAVNGDLSNVIGLPVGLLHQLAPELFASRA